MRLCRRESAHSVSVGVSVFERAKRERRCVFGRRRRPPKLSIDWTKISPSFGRLLGGALVLSTRPKRGAKNLSRPDAKSSPSSSREATVRAKKALSFHLVPRRRVFPAGFSVDRPRARPWDASTIAFFGLINSRFSRARAITRPPDQSHFSLTSLDREKEREKRDRPNRRKKRPRKRERDDPPPTPPTILTVKERKGTFNKRAKSYPSDVKGGAVF